MKSSTYSLRIRVLSYGLLLLLSATVVTCFVVPSTRVTTTFPVGHANHHEHRNFYTGRYNAARVEEIASSDVPDEKEDNDNNDGGPLEVSISLPKNNHTDDTTSLISSSSTEIIILETTETATTTCIADDDDTDEVGRVVQQTSESSMEIPPLYTETIPPLPQQPTTVQPTVGEVEAPSVLKILTFAIPAVGVWLCGPLLSLIDTSAVGLLSGTAQQAALNPAVTVTEYTALLIAFMYTGTTNLVAAAASAAAGTNQGKEEDNNHNKRTTTTTTPQQQNFIAALQLSGFVGASLGLALLAFSSPILKAIIGNDTLDPAVFLAAKKYVRIRALGMPAAAIIGSSQAACLGMQDIKSPLYVLLAAAVVNFLGDAFLVGHAHPWIGGAAGAAWATIFSQYAAVVFFVRWLTSQRTQVPFRRRQPQSTTTTTKGFLHGKFRPRQFFQLPKRQDISHFLPYLIPVTSTQVGRVSSYVAMSHVISSALGTTSMAAQQVIISCWNCLYPVGESLSLTAQSFVPSLVEAPAANRAAVLRQTLWNFWKTGLIFGAGLFGAVLCIPLLNPIFTTDPTVMTMVNAVVPLLLVIFSTLGIFTSSKGMLLGQRDLGFLGKSYAAFFCIVPYFMLRLKRAALSKTTAISLQSVWTVFTLYQLFRTAMWVLRALQLQRRVEKQSSQAKS